MTANRSATKVRGKTRSKVVSRSRPPVASLPMPEGEALAKLPALEVHLFNDRGQHLETAPVVDGSAAFANVVARTRMVRAVVAPVGAGPAAAKAGGALPTIAVTKEKLDRLEFPPDWWSDLVLGYAVHYHGTVEKVVGEATLPICEGTVEVYEVDYSGWIWTVSAYEIARVRDDLIRMFKEPERRLPSLDVLPEPFPWPGPGPEGRFELEAKGPALGAHGLEPTNGALGGAPSRVNETALDIGALAGLEGPTLRNYFYQKRAELLPFLCPLLPHWWYTKSKIGEVAIQPDGTFRGYAGWWLPWLDRPDLYFRVRQTIEGSERTIYSPSVSSSTWWNYAGELVPIRVTDPSAIACSDPLVAQDDQVVFFGLGFDTTTDQAGQPGLVQAGTDAGLYRYPSGKVGPFGKSLHVVLDIDLEGLRDAGLPYYRLSYRRGKQTTIGSPSAWIPLTTPMARRYRKVVGTTVSYPLVSMVPEHSTLPTALQSLEGVMQFPQPGLDYVVIHRADRAFGTFRTEDLPAEGETHGDVADLYTLRLEVFDGLGSDVTAATPILRLRQQETDGSYTTTALDPTQPFLYVHVDNRPMVADIQDLIEAGTTSTGSGCGFLSAETNVDVRTAIKAYHPGALGFAADPDRFLDRWRYRVVRGAGAVEVVDHTVYDTNVGDAASFHALPSAGVPAQRVSTLLRGLLPTTAERERRCTFTVRLAVHTLTRNGYGILDQYDRWDTASFALIDLGMP